MITLHGIGASEGYAIGNFFPFHCCEQTVVKQTITNIEDELDIFATALKKSILELEDFCTNNSNNVDEENLDIFRIHIMMLQDDDFTDQIKNMISKEQVNASYAIQETAKSFALVFETMDDPYMKARATDVYDISKRLLRLVGGYDAANISDVSNVTNPVIIMSDDLTPSETIQLDKAKVLAFVTKKGSKNSHSAILAKALGIPAIVGLDSEYESIVVGTLAIVDGYTGAITMQPDEETLSLYKEKQTQDSENKARLKEFVGKASITLDNVSIEVFANIGHVSDLESVMRNDAEGIGLFRSEFLYMESHSFPSEEVQFQTYKNVLSQMKDKRVVIRTLDLGADKQAPYFNLPQEDNPAMGYRAIRICLDQRDIFRTQLTALLRASVYGKLSVMFPMIISVEEVLEIKKEIALLQAKLKSLSIAYSETIEWGIMIETPAAAMISDLLAPHVDFFSIGTNDLTQYTLATDRMNSKISKLYDTHHPAVLRLIKMTAERAKHHHIWCGICGESASDIELIPFYLAIGITELSVTPTAVLKVREKIRKTNVSQINTQALNKLKIQ